MIRFGFATDTYDAEGEPLGEQPESRRSRLSKSAIWRGNSSARFEQTPPPFSAKKINGVPAYKLARKKKEVSLQPGARSKSSSSKSPS